MFELPPPPAIIEPAPAELREFSDRRKFRRELLDTTREAVLPGLQAAPMLAGGAYGNTQLTSEQFGTTNANQMSTSNSGLSITTASHTPTALTENLYICTCRFNAGAPTDITLSDSLGSAYSVVAGPTIQHAAGVGIIQKIFRLTTTAATARTLTATVTGGGIAATLGWGVERMTFRNPLGLTFVTTLVETQQAEGTSVTLSAVPYSDLHEVFCIGGTNGITTPAGSTRYGNAAWSNGANAVTSVMRNTVPFSQAAGRTRTSTSATRLICHVIHVYFRVLRTARQPTLALTYQEYTASSSSTTKNFTLQIGQARSDRIVIVAVHFHPDSTGSAMNFNAAYADGDTNDVGVNIGVDLPISNPVPRTLLYWYKPTGTTMALTITQSAVLNKVALNVFTLRGCRYAMHVDSGQTADTAAITTQSIGSQVTPARGVGVCSMNRRTGGIPPVNPTVWSGSWASMASDLGPPGGLNGALAPARRDNNTGSDVSETVTATFSVSSSNGGSMLAGGFGP